MSIVQGEKHEAILDAAYSLFGSKGFYETKMSDIAEIAGIAKGTIYLYFKSKEELFTAVTRRDCGQFLDSMRAALKIVGFEERLQVLADRHLRYYYERKEHTKLFFRTPNNDPDLMEFMHQFFREYTKLVQDVLEEGGIAEPGLHAESFIGMMDRHKMDIMMNPSFNEQELEKRSYFVASLFLHGCMAAEESGRPVLVNRSQQQ
ncbi:TetR/AcrR family transcriptional regulator [Paenibacillus sp. JX-17]|uniref:TetR/AcrR family transcriptional regulator n=1 Tax=Paenibacillus lacisoli TaxID=3064525 RepID=A0ABT9C9U6_9BACL|nr:TetR/AcrR family transcriptional regulator [Paenibacillus sp. JX-17]MDO7906029.1 TetR/AcrR family transcriptional regulator [Paenibacillus sp. JX-17]